MASNEPKKATRPRESASKKSDSPSKTKRVASAPRADEMSAEVLEFITAIDDYKRRNERPFPSWTEILEVLKKLGYEKSTSA